MADNQTDTLVKPDMRAVLSRTHIGPDLHGFLLPTLEAVSNAIHGISARQEKEACNGTVDIAINHANDPAQFHISITDNGIGLNDENYQSFKTPFSGFKLKTRGRGFGRFIAFKVFARILYSTRYAAGPASLGKRTFRFDINQANELILFDAEPDFENVGMRVEYNDPLPNWHSLIRELNQSVVADHIASHFLPQFLNGQLPEITIRFGDGEPENITSRFRSIFVESEKGSVDVVIEDKTERVDFSLTKISRTRSFKHHCLLFSAADRIVGSPRDLTNILGQPHFADEKGVPYVIIGVVRAEAFETRLNDARTGINLSPKEIESIVSSIGERIQAGEAEQIEKIKRRQSEDLSGALQENPILRIGLRGKKVSEYVQHKPNSWTAQQFVSDLAIERWRVAKDLTRSITSAASDAANYGENIRELVSRIDQENKEALAEYVVHRKRVIELVEAARKFQGDTNKQAPEDVIHDLVFKRFSDTAEREYFEHNLWLIDDALAFLPYVTSDRTAAGAGRKKGDKVPDLAFFDDSLVLGDNDGTTVTVVEFKRPSRDDYLFGPPKSDPVIQVLDTLELAVRAGGVTRTDGTHMNFTGVIRRFGYIVADLTPTLIEVLRRHDFRNDQNPKIFFRYRDREKILIQAMGYDTLVENAKKRNQAFFSVLLGE